MAKKSNYLSVTQAAKALGLSAVRVRQFCQEGRIGEKCGNFYLISQRELLAFSKLDRPAGRRWQKKR